MSKISERHYTLHMSLYDGDRCVHLFSGETSCERTGHTPIPSTVWVSLIRLRSPRKKETPTTWLRQNEMTTLSWMISLTKMTRRSMGGHPKVVKETKMMFLAHFMLQLISLRSSLTIKWRLMKWKRRVWLNSVFSPISLKYVQEKNCTDNCLSGTLPPRE